MRAIVAVLVAVSLSKASIAQERPRQQSNSQQNALAECARIDESERRLACYDRIARRDTSINQSQQLPMGVEAQWSGNGLTTTRPFRMTGPWEIQWESQRDGIQIYLYRPGGPTGQTMLGVLANQSGPGRGSAYVPNGGEFFLNINAIGRWSARAVRVQ